ncbi:hypothetical protein C0992_007074 [Termitomyces sp. T32_za158]|nr:hypothetical protein C0992_007074 [Termitomyces sp. T32_za158]
MTYDRLPQEILELILDEVSSALTPALLNCSLACSALRDTAQKRLFHDVCIHLPDTGHSLLGQTLVANARLRAFVTTLRIVLEPVLPRTSYCSFPSLPNLAHLNITGDNLQAPLDWSWTLGEDWETCKRDVFRMMCLPTLRTLRICNICEFPVDVLVACGQVQELDVHESSVAPGADDDRDLLCPLLPLPGPRASLQGLCFSYYTFPLLVEALRSRPASRMSIARLETLCLSIFDRDTEQAAREVLSTAAASLRHLELCFEPFFQVSWDTLGLPDPSILRQVTFYITEWDDYGNMNAFLEQMPRASNNLAGVVVHLQCECACAEGAWRRLEELLGAARLEVRVEDEWCADFARLLPRLAGTGRLVVCVE